MLGPVIETRRMLGKGEGVLNKLGGSNENGGLPARGSCHHWETPSLPSRTHDNFPREGYLGGDNLNPTEQ